MKKIWLFLIGISLAWNGLTAQDPANATHGKIIGKVIANNTGVEAASVYLYLVREDAADSLAGGMLTTAKGEFDIPGVRVGQSYRLEVSAIGYQPYEKEFVFRLPSPLDPVVDMGNISLEIGADYLTEVTVTAQRSALQMGIDRKSFDVSQSLNSTGGTAIDVMRNIPSVSVDVDGNVSLRRSSPQIFVDGRPTILTLDQIPADNIERVELITNPSAKFDAASSGGIINVVLKKDKKLGLNGILTLGTGIPKNNNANLSLNWREGKFNFFVNGNYNSSSADPEGRSNRINKRDGLITDYYDQTSITDRNNTFRSVRFGADYFLDNRNTISISQNFVKGSFDNVQTQDQRWYDADRILTRYGDRISEGENGFNRSSTRLSYERKFATTGKRLTADITHDIGKGNNFTSITNQSFLVDGTPMAAAALVENDGRNNNKQTTVQIDYETPFNESGRFEAGARMYINDYESLFESFSVVSGGKTKLPLSNNIAYIEKVYAAYATLGNSFDDIGFKYQLGLRGEYSNFDGKMVDSNRSFGYELPSKLSNIFDALFPSVYLTKDLGNGNEVQLNFSRRVRRPNFWQINPFVDISDAMNIRKGTPGLKPMFTNSFEFNYSKTYDKGSFMAVAYYRNTTNYITTFADTISAELYEELREANVEPTAIVNEFINGSSRNRWGTEFVLQHRFTNNFDVTPSINAQYTMVRAVTDKLDLSNEGFNWDAKLTINYRFLQSHGLLKKLSIQALGEYESPEVTPQGKRLEMYVANIAFRKEFLKNNRGTLTFAVNDIFNTQRRGNVLDTEFYYQDSYFRRNVRNFRLTFTYKFGKADFSLFKRERGNGVDRDDDMGANPGTGGK